MIIMAKVVDRIGERNINNFGSEIVITDYRNAKDVDIYFQNMIGLLEINNMLVSKKES